jgi:hypothetical protein
MDELITRVGYCGWHEHLFRGQRIFADLAGRIGYWQLYVLAIGGPRIDERAVRVLDACATCLAAADPRLPPMKMVRLLSSYGGTVAGIAGGYACAEDAAIGAWTACLGARLLLRIERELGDRREQPDAIEACLRRFRAERVMLHGFGVPARSVDERFEALKRCMHDFGAAEGRYWSLLEAMDQVTQRAFRTPANIAGGVAAASLDLGLSPEQAGTIGIMVTLPAFIASAVEGAEQAPEVLRSLPREHVDYVGTEPRPSPRATRQPAK